MPFVTCGRFKEWRLFLSPLPGRHAAVTPDTALSLEGRGRLDYHMSQNEKREYLLRQSMRGAAPEPAGVNSLEVKFRTRSENGILIHIQESSNYTTVKVRCKFTGDVTWSDRLLRHGLNRFSHNFSPFVLQSVWVLTNAGHDSYIILSWLFPRRWPDEQGLNGLVSKHFFLSWFRGHS